MDITYSFVHCNPLYSTGVLGYYGRLVKETDKAMQFEISPGNLIWFPRSALKINGSIITVARWFRYNDQQWKIIEPVSTFFS